MGGQAAIVEAWLSYYGSGHYKSGLRTKRSRIELRAENTTENTQQNEPELGP
jgi:hypothetical protein